MTKYIDTTYIIGELNGNKVTCEVEMFNNRLIMKFKKSEFVEVDTYDVADFIIEDMHSMDVLEWLKDEDFRWSDRHEQLLENSDYSVMREHIESYLDHEGTLYDYVDQQSYEWGYFCNEALTPSIDLFFHPSFSCSYNESTLMDIIAIFQTCVVKEIPMNDYMANYAYQVLTHLSED